MNEALRCCNKCNVTKALDDFPRQKGCRNDRRPTCKSCMAEKTRLWREADPERAKASVAAVKERDPERWAELDRARSKRYRENNPEKRRESALRYARANTHKAQERYYANPEPVRAKAKLWAQQNPERVRVNALASTNRRRARKLQATPQWADQSLIKAIYEARDRLQAETGCKFHVDHVVPLKGKTVCGLHVPDNLTLLPAEDNLSKGNSYSDDDNQ